MIKLKLHLVFIFLCLSGNPCYSQNADSIKYKYNNLTIYRYGSSFMKGTERLSFGELKNEFSMSEIGLAAYNKAKGYKTYSTVFRIASLAVTLTSLAIIADNGNRNTINLLLVGEIVLGLGTGRFGMLSAQSIDRALWQRNKDVLFPGLR